jgi:RNA polymerase sigma-70 factor (ECF subfamily)
MMSELPERDIERFDTGSWSSAPESAKNRPCFEGGEGDLPRAPTFPKPLVQSATAGEVEIIERILAGEKELFVDLVQPYQKMVYAMAITMLKNEGDAEEVSQEALFKAFKNLSQFRGEAKFSTWIVQITLNEARLRLRSQKKATVQSLDLGMENEDGEHTPIDFADWREIPSEALHRKELRRALNHAIASLRPIYREVLVLRDVQQFSVAETARSLNISEGSVKTRLLRARLQVRDALAPGFDGYWNTGGGEYKRVRPY